MRIGSLFSGIGGFDLGFLRAGMQCAWQVEIDKQCQKLLSDKFPDARRFDDVRQCGKHNLEPVDIICGGFPCQDLSVAGKRAGLAGERSGLWFEFARVIDELKPRWVVIENVPGLLSSNNGKDLEIILDRLEYLRYVVDCDILDARYFGVAQRRRRVFLVCQSIDCLLRQKTTTSAQIIAQALIECLPSILDELNSQFNIGYVISDLPKTYSTDGRQRKMKLFGMGQPESNQMLLENLDAESQRFQAEQDFLDWIPGANGEDTSQTITAILSGDTLEKTDDQLESLNTALSWQSILAEICNSGKLYTTSTQTKRIIELRIFICARTALSIATYISLSNRSCPTYWNAASSALIVLEEFINYARQASSQLFTGMEWIHLWIHFIRQAECASRSLRDTRKAGCLQVLFEPESVSRDFAKSKETWKGTTPDVVGSLDSGGSGGKNAHGGSWPGTTVQSMSAGHAWVVAKSLSARNERNNATDENLLPAYSLTLANTNRNDPYHAEEIAQTLDSWGQAVAFNRTGGTTARDNPVSDKVPALKPQEHIGIVWHENKGGSFTQAETARALRAGASHSYQGIGVRRLTPMECERLQGFPDGWTSEFSDTTRYRMLGNAVTVNVAEWIAKRLMQASS